MAASYLDEARLKRSIAAIATASGPGAIGIVRVSGADAFEIGAGIFSRPKALTSAPSHSILVGKIRTDQGSSIDHVLATVMRAPKTYTGEDTVEFHTHGGRIQVEGVLQTILDGGALPALPGEFTFRAFLSGRIDLTQAESVADLISSSTHAASRIALEASDGVLRITLESISERLLVLRSRLEASIDFVDDDVPTLEQPLIIEELERVQSDIIRLASSYSFGRILREGARVVLSGPPNVGKSSLFNAMLRSDRAIVTDIPGTTRDAVTETVSIEGIPVVLADTAGMRDSSDPIESEGVRRSEQFRESADLVIEVRDATCDDHCLGSVDASRSLLVFNKSDLLPKRSQVLTDRAGISAVHVSALTGEGLPLLVREVAERLAGSWLSSREIAITRKRHYDALINCRNYLATARECISAGEPLEMAALDIRSATGCMDELVGRVYDEDVINRIFSDFCIGK